MSQATFTFRVDGELKDSFTAVAKSLDRSGAQLLRDYMRDIIRRHKEAEEHGAWFREQVQVRAGFGQCRKPGIERRRRSEICCPQG